MARRSDFFEKLKRLLFRVSAAVSGKAAQTAIAATIHVSTKVRVRNARHVPMPDTARVTIKAVTIFFNMPDFMPQKQMSDVRQYKGKKKQ